MTCSFIILSNSTLYSLYVHYFSCYTATLIYQIACDIFSASRLNPNSMMEFTSFYCLISISIPVSIVRGLAGGGLGLLRSRQILLRLHELVNLEKNTQLHLCSTCGLHIFSQFPIHALLFFYKLHFRNIRFKNFDQCYTLNALGMWMMNPGAAYLSSIAAGHPKG